MFVSQEKVSGYVAQAQAAPCVPKITKSSAICMYIVAKRELMFGPRILIYVFFFKLQILIFFVAALPSFSVNMKDADASVCQYSF